MSCFASAYVKSSPWSQLHLHVSWCHAYQVKTQACSQMCPGLNVALHGEHFCARSASSPAVAGPGPLVANTPPCILHSCHEDLHSTVMLLATLASASRIAMAAPQTAQEALRAWLNYLPPESETCSSAVCDGRDFAHLCSSL